MKFILGMLIHWSISIVLCGGKWSFEGRAPKTESYAGEDNFKTKGQTLNLVC